MKYQRICIKCGISKPVSNSMIWLIKKGKATGRCKSCSSLGNTRRLLGQIYDRNLYNTPLYKTWSCMKSRCLRKNNPSYPAYGGRGIKICNEWLTFAGFVKDMGSSFREGLSIERIDNDGNYCKENCRWATDKEQANNRRSNRLLGFMGEVKTLAIWSDLLGIKRTTISQRIDVYGWSVAEALSKSI